MMTARHQFRAVRAEDLPGVVSLLQACALPTDDLASVGLEYFELAVDGQGRIVGVAGFDRGGGDALLRSLAVAPDWRQRGLGAQLVARREAAARVAGVSRFFLLTTSAADYFRRQGYRDELRDKVPAAIAAHAQFRGLCPASARCLQKSLDAPTREASVHQSTPGVPMKTLAVFDPAMCCSTGVCGVDVDPVLVQFAADLQWVAEQGVEVKRYNLGQEPQAFAANAAVLKEMDAGMDRLPIITIDGHLVATGAYLSRSQLAQKLGLQLGHDDKPQIKIGGGCCTPKSGCC